MVRKGYFVKENISAHISTEANSTELKYILNAGTWATKAYPK